MIENNQFYILRHGETEYQTRKKHMVYPAKGSLTSIGLTKKGRSQIVEAASKLKNRKIDYIYSSDFLRTKQTRLIVAREIGIPKTNLFLSDKLRDINLGIYRGKSRKKFYRDMGKVPRNFNQRPEEGESLNEVSKRMVDFIKKIDKKYKGKNILIISHGEPLWLLEGAVKRRKKSDLMEGFVKKNYIQTGELKKL